MRREIVGKEKNTVAKPSTAFKVGAIAFTFLIVGYQSALFVHRATQLRVAERRDRPDTVYVIDGDVAARILGEDAGRDTLAAAAVTRSGEPRKDTSTRPRVIVRKDAEHSEPIAKARESARRVETFHFNPNTVSVSDMQRLGFSEKQALSIEAYREKGGQFRRKSDFAKSYVVSDSVYKRLEPYIDIPLVDINKADSAAFDALPGIGPYFAAKMVSFRDELGGYSCKEQLMDIWNFDREKYDGLADLVTCSAPRDSFDLWHLPVEGLRKHPYLKSWSVARSVVLYRQSTPKEEWTVENLAKAGIVSEEIAGKLSRCAILKP